MTRQLLIALCSLLLFIGCGSNNDKSDKNENQPEEKMTEISVAQLHELAQSNQDMFLLDVRTKPEFDEARLSFADLRIPYDSLGDAFDQLPDDKTSTIYCFCRSGRRSGIAASLLRQNGYVNAINVTGGIIAWRDAGYDVIGGIGR